jgi:hypothetical protein
LLAFGARSAGYVVSDVAIIETEMVAAGKWIEVTPRPERSSLLDIGAIGFYGNRPILIWQDWSRLK